MRRLFLSLAVFPLAACAAGSTGLEDREHAALERELAGRVAGEPRSCISAGTSQGLQVVSGRTMVYRTGETVWVNRPLRGCTGLRPLANLLVETHGNRYCRGDHVRALEPGGYIAGPACVLGDFVPYRRTANG